MTLFSALSSSLSGLKTVTTQMQLVAKNISNAGNESYTRKDVTLASISLGDVGGGVEISGYTRSMNTALFKTLTTATSLSNFRGTQDTYLQRVMTLMSLTGNSSEKPALTEAISKFAKSWSEFSASPESNVTQQQVIQDADNLVTQVKYIYAEVDSLDTQITTDINNTLSNLNAKLEAIAKLNTQIATAYNSNLPAGDLEDSRDQLVQDVAKITNVNIMQRAQGQIALYTRGGYALVDSKAQSFSYDGANVSSDLDPLTSLNDVLIGGSLEAAVQFRATATPVSTDPATNVIQKLRSQMDLIISAFTTSSAGPPETFAYAYANATGTAGEATSIFVGATVSSFAVNPNLLDGTETIKVSCGVDVADTFNDSTRTFSADGLNIVGASYESLSSSIMTSFQQAASSVSVLSENITSQYTYIRQKLVNEVGVDIDTETIQLTALKNAYAASARVMTIIQEMFDELQRIV